MAKITLTLNEQSSGQSVARYNLDTGGSALHIQAQNGVNYQFTDDATGLGPQGVTASKQGSDLVVTLDGSGPDLVIENYFSQGQGALIGVQADGSFTSYPVAAAPEHTLASEIVTEQALGSDQVPIAPLAVLGGVGLIAGGIALANDKDGKSYKEPAPAPDNNHPDSTPNSPEAPKVPDVTPKKPDNTPPYTPTPIPDPMPSPLPPSPNNPSPAPNPPGPSPSPSPSPSPNNPNQPKPGSAPVAADDKESASPGETVTIDVLKNDSDPDGVTNIDVNSVRLLDAAGRPATTLKVPGEGEWNVTFNGHVTFKPEAGFTGNPTPVQYTISDAEGHTSKPAKITLTYDPTQQPNTPGAVLLEGEAKIGGTLKAVVADNDGVQPGTVKYQWFAEGDAIPGATGESYTVTAADRGKHISVYVSYTDGKNHVETHNGTTGIIGDTVTPTPMPNPTPIPQPNPNPAPNPLNPSPQMPGHPGIPDPNLKAYQPVLYDDTVKAHRGGKVTINVVENDTDAQRDIDPNTVQLLDKDGKGVTRLVVDKQGVWTVGRGGNVTFTPDKDFDKGNPDPVEYVLSDRNGNPSYNRAKITIEYPDAANNQEGKVELVGATKVGQTLIANVEDADGVQPENIKYQWFANGDAITGANGRSYTIQPIDRGKTLTVHVEYKDGAGHDEAFSSQPSAPVDAALTPTTPTPTPPPSAPNNPPSGNVTISGTAKVGEKLTASNDLQDADGMGSVKYRWFANGEEVGQGDSYTLKAADKGKTITVKAEYTDGKNHAESVESAKTAAVADSGTTPPPGAPNNPPSGNVTISGTAKVGEKLTASNDLQDADGMGSVKYRWFANGEEVGQGDSYTLKAADKGKTITVKAEYTDGKQHAESVESAKTAEVADSGTTPPPGAPNNPPSGNVTISGTAKVGEKLTASNDLQDADGMGSVKYRWFANGEEIGQGDSYTLKAADKGKTITVKAEYTDGKQHAESVESAKTAEVADSGTTPPPGAPNNPPSGNVTISGTAKVGEKLTASNDLQDDDGLGTIRYRWFANGEEVGQGDSYTLKAADKGKTITVKAEYTDGRQHAESVESAKTAEVADSGTTPPPGAPNQPGTVTISGKTAVGETLTATAHDDDGVPANVNYGWFIDNKPVGTDASYTIQPGDKGKTITVKAIYTDGAGHAEIVTSEPTAAITDSGTTPPPTIPNNSPIGNVTISGIAKVGETLTASNDLQDDDGMGSVTYHWYAGGKEVGTGASYQLTEADKGKTITVKAEYTDGKQHAESVESSATAAVEDSGTTPPPTTPNNPPIGNVTISGTAKVGETLTASNDLQDDDGMGSVTYHWYAGGKEVGTGASYQLTEADKGKTITVKAEYTDGKQHAESVESAKTAEVADSGTTPPPGAPNQPGSVAISGEAKVGGELTATVSDGDGVPNSVQYQWLRDGQPIDGATAQTYRLTAADAGHKITVQASYDDNAAHHESPTSAASDIGAQNNADQPTVSISGSDSVNEGGAATYTVGLDHASDQPVTVTLTLRHIETTDADFAPQPIEKNLTIPAGQTSATFSVNTADDRLPENNEHYRIEISAPQGAKLDADKTGVTTQIIDNDESAANHNGTNTDTTFAGDRNADTPYFVKTLDSGYNGYGHLLGHKPGEGIKVTYAFNTSGKDTDGSTLAGFQAYSETQKAAIRTVLDHIAEHVNIKYTEGDNATLNFYKHTMDSERKVGYGVYGGGVHLSAERFSADDAFRSDIPYRIANGDAIEYYGWHSALHEVGHTLGLNHTFGNKGSTPNLDKVEDRDDLSVMSYTPGQTVPRLDVGNGNYYENYPIAQNKLGIYDLAALHHSFGVNPDYHSGNDTYGFKEFNKDAVGNDIYIHDGGGLDTFDAHEQTLDLNIDLTPGSWIYAGEKTAHLALNNDGTPTEHQMFIGYGTQIENAKGGSGNDTIKGNSAANYLFGFDGDDTIDGGAGNDQIEGGRGADTLTGGKGADHFIFASPLDGKADTITDFSFSEGDLLQLDHHIFTALESGTLAADQFVAGKEAKDANDHLLYDRTTGELAYDPDGSGSAVAVTIARLGANHDLDHNGIQII